MGVCAQCKWFRRTKPASQLLAGAFSSSSADVAQALGKVVEDEQKQRDAEADYKRIQDAAGKDLWAGRPVLTDYCGLDEEKGAYYIAEVKNLGGRCRQHDPDPPPRQACSECQHERTPEGAARDAVREQAYVKLAARNISADVKKDTTESLLDGYRKGTSARQALEVTGVYQTRGHLLHPPAYLTYCAAFSTADDYVTCLFQNPYHLCSKWKAGPEAMTSEQDQAQPSTGAAGGQNAAPPPMPARPGPTDPLRPLGGAPPFVGHAPVAAEGGAEGVLKQLGALLEWILDVPLTPEIWQQLESSIRLDTNSSQDIEGVGLGLQLHESISTQDIDTLEYVRELHQPAFVADLRAQGDDLCRALVAAYDRANPPIAQGSPPLTKEVADAYLGVLSLVDALMENRAWTPMSEQVKTAFAEQLADSYPQMSPQQQAWLAMLPAEWPKTRILLRTMAEPDRRGLAQQLVADFGDVVQATPLLAQPSPRSFAPSADGGTDPPHPSPPMDPRSSAEDSGGGKSIDELLQDIISTQQSEEREAAKSDPELAAQMKAQNQLKTASLMSNMMMMQHQASMAIINNIRN